MPLFWQDSFELESGPEIGGGTRSAVNHDDTLNGTGPFNRDGDDTDGLFGIDPSDPVEIGAGGDDDFFVRTNYVGRADGKSGREDLGFDRDYTGRDGDWFWYMEDVEDSTSSGGNDVDRGVLEWTGIDIAGKGGLEFKGLFGARESGAKYEDGQFLKVEYSIDGGDFVTGIQFVGVDVGTEGGPDLLLDVNQDGVWTMADDGFVKLDLTFTEYGFDIAGTGTTLTLRMENNDNIGTATNGDGSGASEEIVIDNFRLEFAGAPNVAPVAAGLEAADLAYTSGAVAVTSAITLSDSDDANLEGATVEISSGFVSGSDTLAFTDANGITGAFAGNVLTLSGTATVAQYQAALRTVTFESTDAAPIFDRDVTITVNDGTDDSNSLTRTIDLPTPELVTTTFWLEDFELATGPDIGGGTREATNHADTLNGSGPVDTNGDGSYIVLDAAGDPVLDINGDAIVEQHGPGGASNYFVRTFEAGLGDVGFNAGFSGFSGDWYWRGEDVGASVDGTNRSDVGTLNWTGIDISNTQNITFDGLFGARVGSLEFETVDSVKVEYSIDGGAWVTGLAFLGTGVAPSGLGHDANLNGTLDASETTELGHTFAGFSFDVDGTGSLLDLRLVTTSISGNEEIGFDNFSLGGEAVAGTDIIGTNNGNDLLQATAEDESIFGLDGNDILIGAGGADALDGGAGMDMARYNGSDAVTVDLAAGTGAGGDAAGDTLTSIENLFGTRFADTLTGDAGNNRLYGDHLGDTLDGGAGNDVLYGGSGGDMIDGGAGVDMASYEASFMGVTVNLGTGKAHTGHAQGDVLTTIENLFGSLADDTFTGDAGNNTLFGSDGADTLAGGAGTDSLFGGDGSDTFVFESGDSRTYVRDFEDGVDIIDLSSYGFGAAADALGQMSQAGAHVRFADSGDILLIFNTNLADISAADLDIGGVL